MGMDESSLYSLTHFPPYATCGVSVGWHGSYLPALMMGSIKAAAGKTQGCLSIVKCDVAERISYVVGDGDSMRHSILVHLHYKLWYG